MGYSCSNINGPPFDGLIGAYLGLGIDEYGNFLHGAQLASWYTGTNTVNPTILGYSAPNGDNSQYGLGYYPYGRIGLRGAGNVAWSYLNSTYPQYYPSSLPAPTTGFNAQQAAVQLTCIRGQVQDYSQASAHGNYSTCLTQNGKGTPSTATNICPNSVSTATLTAAGLPALTDYAPIPGGYAELPASTTPVLANESAVARPTGLTTNGVTSGNVFLYNLKITQSGLLSLSYSINGGAYAPVITNQSITASNGALPSQLRFGFTGATGGSNNIHELLCFKAEPVLQSSSSASGDEKQTSEVQTTSQAYFAFYDPNDWTGRVTAYGLNDSGGTLTINSQATWDAQCVLTGSTNCVTTGVAGPTTPEAPTSRVMLTWNTVDTAAAPGTGGIAFEWPGGGPTALTSSEQGIIDAGDATATANRVNYLRGQRSNEISATTGLGLYRARDGVLGDIIDSSPAWVGPPSAPYVLTWKDNLNPGTSMPENSGQSYATFTSAEQSRLNVVYVGANDGFLHGFRSGVEDTAGNVTSDSTTPNDGLEVLAYMPGAILNTIHPYSATPSVETLDATLDYSNASYVHNYFVDATPGTGDL